MRMCVFPLYSNIHTYKYIHI